MRCGDYLVAEYTYNTFGERIKKVTYSGKQKTVTYYFYDGHTLTAEANEQGKIQSQYIYLKHQPIAKLEGKNIYAIHSNHLGTPRVATNDDKQTVWKAEITKQSITLNLRLPGQYEDKETGTHYNYLRDYDPETGRYITSDPIGLKGGVNTYAYVSGNPLRFIDKMGLAIQIPEEDNSTMLDRMSVFIDSLGGQQAIKNIIGKDALDIMGHLGPAITKDINQRYRIKGITPPEYLKPEVLNEVLVGVAAIAALNKFASKIAKFPVKNPVTGIAAVLIKALTKTMLIDALVDGIDGGHELINRLINEFENLSALHKDTDGIIWDKNDLLGIQNCKTLDNAAGSIVTGVMGVVSAGLGKKFFGRKDKKNDKKHPKNIDEAYKLYKKKGGSLPFHYWFSSKAAGTKLKGGKKITVAKLRNYAKKHNWKYKGNWLYPPNNGFDGRARTRNVLKGSIISRYSFNKPKDDTGKYFSYEAVSYAERALPEKGTLYRYRVLKSMSNVKSGKALSWFDHPGGGLQFESTLSIKELIKQGYIEVIN